MKNFAKVLGIIYSLSLFNFLPAVAQDLSNGLIVKLSAGTTVEQFLEENNYSPDKIRVGQDGYILLKTNELPAPDQNDINRRSNLNNYGLSGVENAEINNSYELHATPNDSYYLSEQWNLHNINIESVWDDTTGSNDMTIAVLDTGFYYNHEDFQNKMWNNQDEIAGNGIDDDGNSYIDDKNGYNFVLDDNDIFDNWGHGTGTSSIISANTNNSLGMAGMNWKGKIMPVKVCEVGYNCPYFSIAEGIYYAVNNDAKVINMSLGGSYDSPIVRNAVEYASNHNVLIVASAGNNNGTIGYPARYSQVIAVGAVDQSDTRASFSSFGPELDLVAPGVSVFTAYKNNPSSYTLYSGTSFSAPHVAGAGAILWGYKPDLTAEQIRSYIVYNAEKVDGMTDGFWDEYYGYGRLDVQTSLNQIKIDNNIIGIEGRHESENLSHQIGSIVEDQNSSNGKAVKATSYDGPGFLQYGPYVGTNTVDNSYLAKFRLQTSDNTNPEIIARIETNNYDAPNEWQFLDIRGTDFDHSNVYQDFYLKFTKDSTGPMEYRVYTLGLTDLMVDFTEVTRTSTDDTYQYQSEDLPRQAGAVIYDTNASESLAVQVKPTDIGFAQYGPYSQNLISNDRYRAIFRLQANNIYSNTDIARLEVFNHNHPEMSVYRNIKATDFMTTQNYEEIGLTFETGDNDTLEYRVYSYGNNENIALNLDAVTIITDVYYPTLNYEAEDMPGQTGKLIAESNLSHDKARMGYVNYDNPGFLVYGPYSSLEENKNYYAQFKLRTNNLAATGPIARLEVYNPGGNSPFVAKDITGQMFAEANVWQNFTVHFARGTGGTMEYRVWFYKNTDLAVDNIRVIEKSDTYLIYEAEDLNLGIGEVVRDSYNQQISVKATAGQGPGYVVYGPYTTDQSPGNYQATFKIKNRGTSSNPLVRIDAVNVGGSGDYAYSDLYQNDFGANYYTNNSIYFTRTADGTMEYRVYTYGQTDIMVDSITIEKVS
ncbi:S8 family serine peptidase [Patescibacteria group bacterium]|nr:S8 family serine peptidase [Patescibacteria group bacterium]